MRISFHTEEIENHSLGFRKLPYQTHQLRFRNLCDLFIGRFGNLFRCRFQWLQIHPFGFSKVIDHHVHRDSSAPGFQRPCRLVLPNRVKDLDHTVMHQVSSQFPVAHVSDTERKEVSRIPCIQLMPGLFVPSGAQLCQFDVLYVNNLCQLVSLT